MTAVLNFDGKVVKVTPMYVRYVCSFLLIAVFLTTQCRAENQFCLGGDTDQMTASEKKACNTQMQAAKRLVSQYSNLNNWHFVLVCGRANWLDYSSFAHGDSSALQQAVADTSITDRTTFLRGDMLFKQDGSAIDPRMLSALNELGSNVVVASR